MPSHVLSNPLFKLNGVDLTSYIRELVLSYETEAVEQTASGDGTRTRLAGLEDWSISATLKQNYDASAVHDTLWAAKSSSTNAVILQPTTSAPSGTNPRWSGSAVLESFPVVNGSIGDLHEVPISLVANGALSESTST